MLAEEILQLWGCHRQRQIAHRRLETRAVMSLNLNWNRVMLLGFSRYQPPLSEFLCNDININLEAPFQIEMLMQRVELNTLYSDIIT